MLQIEHRENMQGHNLNIKADGLPECGLQEQMLKYNNPDGLLKLQVKRMNNSKEYSYDVSGMVALSDYLTHVPINLKILSSVTEKLVSTVFIGKEYFLDEQDIVFSPDTIFLKPEKEKPIIRFCYLPGYGKPLREQLCAFYEDVMKELNYEDRKLVDYVYSVYKKVSSPYSVLNDLVGLQDDFKENKKTADKPEDEGQDAVPETARQYRKTFLKEEGTLQETADRETYSKREAFENNKNNKAADDRNRRESGSSKNSAGKNGAVKNGSGKSDIRESRRENSIKEKSVIDKMRDIKEKYPYSGRYAMMLAAGIFISMIVVYSSVNGLFISESGVDIKRLAASVLGTAGLILLIVYEKKSIEREKKDAWDTLKGIHSGPLAEDKRYNGIDYVRPGSDTIRKTSEGFVFRDFLFSDENDSENYSENGSENYSENYDENDSENDSEINMKYSVYEKTEGVINSEDATLVETFREKKKSDFLSINALRNIDAEEAAEKTEAMEKGEGRKEKESDKNAEVENNKEIENNKETQNNKETETTYETEESELALYEFETIYGREEARDISAIVNGSDYETMVLDASAREGFYLDPRYGNSYEKVEIDNFPFCVGSSSLSDGVILSRTISRRHAVFEKVDNGICLRDLNSKNGTYVNGSKLYRGECVRVMPDDVITFSNREYVLRRRFAPGNTQEYYENGREFKKDIKPAASVKEEMTEMEREFLKRSGLISDKKRQ